MADSTDILLKAAEDVTSGMWCKGAMFSYVGETPLTYLPGIGELDLDEALRMKRCAIGSVAVATELLGGTVDDYREACQRTVNHIDVDGDPFDIPGLVANAEAQLAWFNDHHLPDDPFEAGQTLADLFRRAADTC